MPNSPLSPDKVEHKSLDPKLQAIEVPPGHVYVVPIKDGKEAESGFFTTEKMMKKTYSDPAKFVVKKKAN